MNLTPEVPSLQNIDTVPILHLQKHANRDSESAKIDSLTQVLSDDLTIKARHAQKFDINETVNRSDKAVESIPHNDDQKIEKLDCNLSSEITAKLRDLNELEEKKKENIVHHTEKLTQLEDLLCISDTNNDNIKDNDDVFRNAETLVCMDIEKNDSIHEKFGADDIAVNEAEPQSLDSSNANKSQEHVYANAVITQIADSNDCLLVNQSEANVHAGCDVEMSDDSSFRKKLEAKKQLTGINVADSKLNSVKEEASNHSSDNMHLAGMIDTISANQFNMVNETSNVPIYNGLSFSNYGENIKVVPAGRGIVTPTTNRTKCSQNCKDNAQEADSNNQRLGKSFDDLIFSLNLALSEVRRVGEIADKLKQYAIRSNERSSVVYDRIQNVERNVNENVVAFQSQSRLFEEYLKNLEQLVQKGYNKMKTNDDEVLYAIEETKIRINKITSKLDQRLKDIKEIVLEHADEKEGRIEEAILNIKLQLVDYHKKVESSSQVLCDINYELRENNNLLALIHKTLKESSVANERAFLEKRNLFNDNITHVFGYGMLAITIGVLLIKLKFA